MTPATPVRILATFMLGLPLCACSGSSTPPSAEAAGSVSADLATAQAASTPAVAEAVLPKACELVSARQMSEILGGEVNSQANEGSSGKTECIYSAVSGISPYAEFSVAWGEGEAAMNAAGAMGKQEAGMVSPYDGIGDQAVSVGTVLMIRKGKDLVSITLSGVDDMPAAARKIYDTAATKF